MEEKKIGFFQKLKNGLQKTRDAVFTSLFGSSEQRVNDEFFDELEEGMLLADMGMEQSELLLDELRDTVHSEHIKTRDEAKQALIRIVADHLRPQKTFAPESGPAVLMIVGVNGVGKTTSIGKLAKFYKEQGKKPMMAAADTFRAAAAEQLGEWAQRADVPMVRGAEGADPSSVVFDAIQSYRAKGNDLLLVDTAGRLHNKANLMKELEKMRRVIARELPDVPCESLLVLDATTGQNAMAQAKAFAEVTGLDGIILTKLDGTAKGGIVVALSGNASLPVRFIGVGEQADDLRPFDPDQFAAALF